MARIEKTVFISYRRTDVYTALAVYQELSRLGYDVFFDYTSIPSGDFEQIIVSNIKARAHFVLILTPTALDRCSEPGDWLRREIEIAMDEKRNIIPLFFKGFKFGDLSTSEILTGKLKDLSRYNGMNVHEDYFVAAMDRLSKQFLSVPLETILLPVSKEVRRVVEEEQVAADEALLEKGEDIKELIRQPLAEEEERMPAEATGPVIPVPPEEIGHATGRKMANWRLYGLGAGILAAILLAIAGINAILQAGNKQSTLPTQTMTRETAPAEFTQTSPPPPASTATLPPSPVPTLGVGSMKTSQADGMNLLFIPAGEFAMGSDVESDEKPVHTVFLDAFWIDQTEVTNAMYAGCVEDGRCNPPASIRSFTRDSYFGNPEFDNHPVLHVSWDNARAYCSWAGRRLPTEAEWEKAAGWDEENQSQRLFPWGGNSFDGSRANICDLKCPREVKNTAIDDGFGDTAPVGSYPAGVSFYGALDIAGNVWEWVDDWYAAYPGNTEGNPEFGTTKKVVRGGSWFFPNESVFRSANRAPNDPAQPNDAIGFRCAVSE